MKSSHKKTVHEMWDFFLCKAAHFNVFLSTSQAFILMYVMS